jgi:hypothetical protein
VFVGAGGNGAICLPGLGRHQARPKNPTSAMHSSAYMKDEKNRKEESPPAFRPFNRDLKNTRAA